MKTSLAIMVAVVSGLALLPQGAWANDDNYACSLTPSAGVVKKEFGLPHAGKQKDPGGGTDDKAGAFTSTCIVIAWTTKPKQGARPFGLPPKFVTRQGFAKLVVETTIQSTEEAGENWDPEKLRLHNLALYDGLFEAFKGHEVVFPLFGQSEEHGIEWGLIADNARGFWEHEEQGFISIQVSSHGEAAVHLYHLAHQIVPTFRP